MEKFKREFYKKDEQLEMNAFNFFESSETDTHSTTQNQKVINYLLRSSFKRKKEFIE